MTFRVVDEFPHDVREIENCWIPLPDGSRLAARLWLPARIPPGGVPAVIEYIPYRKRYGTRGRDDPMHRYFAGHGYAAVRIDVRGSGESDGVLLDEYTDQEQQDGVEAIAWIGAQPWCSGAVGMIGKSWGGFSALQVAARRPPELRGIVAVCAADDRYADDAHYMGGCLLNENLVWGSMLLAINAQPPDPQLLPDRWRSLWLERMERAPLYPETWLRHPRRDDYWRHGSVCEDWEAIQCPVYAVGGWADGYTNAVPRMLAGLRAPARGLVGPWAHLYPHEGVPGPAIGFLQEVLRFWERWLRGIDNGWQDEPAYRVWMQDSVRPGPLEGERPGRWVAETMWPSPRIVRRVLHVTGDGLRAEPGPHRVLEHTTPQTCGLAAGAWCGFGLEGESPGDQGGDDAVSLVFDSDPLQERLEILGAPCVELELSVDRPSAFLAARLCDVAPDGSSARVSYGVLNLAHKEGHDAPVAVAPGRRFRTRIELNHAAHSFPAGHRLRLALSTAYWPVVWPSPEPVRLALHAGSGALELPERPTAEHDARLPAFGVPEAAAPPPATDLHEGGVRRTEQRDPETGEVTLTMELDLDEAGEVALTWLQPIDLHVGHGMIERFAIHPDDPLSARAEVEHRIVCARKDWRIGVHSRVAMRSDRERFWLEAELEATEGGRSVFRRHWSRSVARLLV